MKRREVEDIPFRCLPTQQSAGRGTKLQSLLSSQTWENEHHQPKPCEPPHFPPVLGPALSHSPQWLLQTVITLSKNLIHLFSTNHLTTETKRNENFQCSSRKSYTAIFIHFHSSFLFSSLRMWGFPPHVQYQFGLMCPWPHLFYFQLLWESIKFCSVAYLLFFLDSQLFLLVASFTPSFVFFSTQLSWRYGSSVRCHSSLSRLFSHILSTSLLIHLLLYRLWSVFVSPIFCWNCSR